MLVRLADAAELPRAHAARADRPTTEDLRLPAPAAGERARPGETEPTPHLRARAAHGPPAGGRGRTARPSGSRAPSSAAPRTFLTDCFVDPDRLGQRHRPARCWTRCWTRAGTAAHVRVRRPRRAAAVRALRDAAAAPLLWLRVESDRVAWPPRRPSWSPWRPTTRSCVDARRLTSCARRVPPALGCGDRGGAIPLARPRRPGRGLCLDRAVHERLAPRRGAGRSARPAPAARRRRRRRAGRGRPGVQHGRRRGDPDARPPPRAAAAVPGQRAGRRPGHWMATHARTSTLRATCPRCCTADRRSGRPVSCGHVDRERARPHGLRRAGRVVAAVLAETARAAVEPGITTAELDRVAPTPSRPAAPPGAGRRLRRAVRDLRQRQRRRRARAAPGPRAVRGRRPRQARRDRRAGRLRRRRRDHRRRAAGARPHAQRLAACTRAALADGMAQARAGAPVSAIGRAVERRVRRGGFTVLRGLTGHGIGRTIHEPPTVPNWDDPRARGRLTNGLVITVEPLVSAGARRAGGGRGRLDDPHRRRRARGARGAHDRGHPRPADRAHRRGLTARRSSPRSGTRSASPGRRRPRRRSPRARSGCPPRRASGPPARPSRRPASRSARCARRSA